MNRRRILIRTLIVLILLGVGIHIYNKDLWGEVSRNADPLVIAHRGASGIAPENTLLAIQKAIEMNVDFIEIDIHLSKDGEIVLMHDATVDRTTDGEGAISDYTLAKLKELDAGSWMGSQFKNERIPTLREVLEQVDGQVRILLEVKQGEDGRYSGFEEKILAEIEENEASSWIVIQSFQAETVNRFMELAPKMEVHKLILGELPLIPLHHDGEFQFRKAGNFEGVASINPWFPMLTQRLVNRIHSRGKKITVFTVNDREDLQTAWEMGVDGIITDFPDRLIQLKKEDTRSDREN